MAGFSSPFAQRLTKTASVPEIPTIRPRDPAARIPLSFAQVPMWLAESLEPGGSVYNEGFGIRLHGRLDIAALQGALDSIVRRHEIFRTAFRVVDGEPSQVVLPPVPFALEFSERPGARLGTPELDEMFETFVRRPCSFADARLTRALAVRLAPDDLAIVFMLHHIVFDRWSARTFYEELAAGVASGELGTERPSLAVQYGDYALWQRELHAAGAFEKQRAYWAQRLRGAPLVLDLPGDRPRSGDQRAPGGIRAITIPAPVVTALRAISRGADASFFMLLMAAFQTYLYRTTGQADIVTGFPVAGRAVPETERLIGCFVNTVALRTEFAAGMTFRDVFAQVRERALEAYDNQDYPFERLIDDLRPQRLLGLNPIVQTLVTKVDQRPGQVRESKLQAAAITLAVGHPKVDLSLEMIEAADGLTCRFEYSGIFEEYTAARMLDHFGILLESIAANPDADIAELRTISAAEHENTVHGWNPPVHVPTDQRVDELFAQQVARNPGVPALQGGSETLSYAELDRRANALADRLRASGVRADSVVGVCLARSIEMIVAQLAIVKAGAAYLPLDPNYPPARIAFMVRDSAALAVVTDSALANDALPDGIALLLVAGEDSSAPQRGSGEVAAGGVRSPSAFDAAYVIYTSGTTGTPKGVQIEHRSLCAYLTAAIAAFELGPGDRVLQFAATSFDASVLEIWGALCSGAALVLRDDAMIVSPAKFLRTCEDWGITVLSLPTAYWRDLAGAVGNGDALLPDTVRLTLVGGEAMSAQHAALWQRAAGGRSTLVNHYGPTETTVAATWHTVPAAHTLENGGGVSIGRPHAHARCYVLDERQGPVPINVAGELCIGGAGVGRGYLNDASLTAKRFVPDPFVPGAIMYRTGDRARFRADGGIEFLGRIDRQVKLRGFRIEPAEIENVLMQHPAVREAVVDVVTGADGSDRLAAFVRSAATASELRSFLAVRLPNHLIPAQLIAVASMPLTPARKIDRAALAMLADTDRSAETLTDPVTSTERAIAALWAGLLGAERIGADDDFFALGGHSVLAATMLAAVNEQFGTVLPLRELFEHSTVRALGAAVDAVAAGSGAAPNAGDEPSAIVQLRSGPGTPFFFLHGDYVDAGLYGVRIAEGLGHDRPFYVVEPHQLDDDGDPIAVRAMAADRLGAVRALQPHGPYLLGGYCVGGVVAYEMARMLSEDGEEVRQVVLIDTPRGVFRIGRLREVVNTIATLCRWSPEREQREYFRWHRRLTYVLRADAAQRFGWIGRVLGLRSRSPKDVGSEVEQRYFESLTRYHPAAYAGRLLMINCRPRNRKSGYRHMDWASLAPSSAIRFIDGDHESLVRDHGVEIGDILRRAFMEEEKTEH